MKLKNYFKNHGFYIKKKNGFFFLLTSIIIVKSMSSVLFSVYVNCILFFRGTTFKIKTILFILQSCIEL